MSADLWIIFQESGRLACLSGQRASCALYYCCIRPRVRANEVRLLSLGALRLLRSSRFALTQPDACGAGESLGDVEIGSSGEGSPNLQNSKSHSSESNREHLFAYAAEAIW